MSRRTPLAIALAAALGAACGGPPPVEPERPSRYSVTSAKSADGVVDLLVLRDEDAGVEFSVAPTKGGEMSGLRVRLGDRWIETLYLAEDYAPREGWTGKAPLLWPATGRNFPKGFTPQPKPDGSIERGRYTLDGKTYEMPGHGFARDLAWTVESATADANGARAVLAVEDDETTRALYPFGFRLVVAYTLENGEVGIHYDVAAKPANTRPMPFSIGNHITFNTPLVPGGDAGAVTMTTPSTRELLKDGGVPTGQWRPRSHAEPIPLGRMERLEAISLTGYEADPEVVLRDPAGLAIRMRHTASRLPEQPWVAFNMWGDPSAGYYSPEPWVGLQQSFVLDKGLVKLEPGELFEWAIRIAFER